MDIDFNDTGVMVEVMLQIFLISPYTTRLYSGPRTGFTVSSLVLKLSYLSFLFCQFCVWVSCGYLT